MKTVGTVGTVKTVGIKKFNREMYHYINDLPLVVVNLTKKVPLFIVLPPDKAILDALKKGGEDK